MTRVNGWRGISAIAKIDEQDRADGHGLRVGADLHQVQAVLHQHDQQRAQQNRQRAPLTAGRLTTPAMTQAAIDSSGRLAPMFDSPVSSRAVSSRPTARPSRWTT